MINAAQKNIYKIDIEARAYRCIY